MTTPATKAVDDRIRAYLRHVTRRPNYNGFDAQPLRQVEYVSASLPRASTTFRFTVDAAMANMDGNLHGGAAATIFDNLTSTALLARDRPPRAAAAGPGSGSGSGSGPADYATYDLGVSRSLLVTFLRPLPLGTEVELVCEVVAAGRRLAQLRGAMMTTTVGGGGKVCATCIHEKVFVEEPVKL